jgi:hypothetical protein
MSRRTVDLPTPLAPVTRKNMSARYQGARLAVIF